MELFDVGIGLLVGWILANIYNFFEIRRILNLRDCDHCEYLLQSQEAEKKGAEK